MFKEFDALLRNGSWDLIPPHPSQNLVGCKWVFRIKHDKDGTINAVARGWSLRQININNDFLHGTLYENVYMSHNLLPSLTLIILIMSANSRKLFMVLNRHLVLGTLNCTLIFFTWAFTSAQFNTSVFIFWEGDFHAYLLIYVDDIIFMGSDPYRVDQLIAQLAEPFSLKDLGPLQCFLGVEVCTHPACLLLSQR